MTEYTIDAEPAIAAVTAGSEFDVFDKDASQRLKKATAAQIASYVRSTITGGGISEVNTAITTAGAGTLTAAALVGGVITRSGPTASYTDTTDSAANIIAALPAGAAVGFSWELSIENQTAFAQTIAAGTGVTLSGFTQIGGNCNGRYLATYTGAGAVSLYGLWTNVRGINNLSATTDPGAGNDNTQGYGPGSEWINTTNNREWTCVSAATGAAVWSFSGAVLGSAEPAGIVTQAGASTGSFAEEGNINRQMSLAGVGNGADTTDDVLFTYSLPASAFDQAGRGVCVTAYGKLAANGNNKRVKLWFGATVVADSGVSTGNAVGWQLSADVFKVGAVGSNTQTAQGQSIVGGTHGGVNVPPAPTETESGAIVVKVTGTSPTTGAANDVLANFFQVNFMN
jgi:hypothetical protein